MPKASTPDVRLTDESGTSLPCLARACAGTTTARWPTVTLTFLASDVPAVGYRTYLAIPAATGGDPWVPAGGRPTAARSRTSAFAVPADPDRGGTLSSIIDLRSGTELLAGPGNELLLQEEYPSHPRWGEGPWMLCQTGPWRSSAEPRRVGAGAAVPDRLPGWSPSSTSATSHHPGDAAVGRRGPDRVPHPRGRLDRPGPAAAGPVRPSGTRRHARVPDRAVGDRPPARPDRRGRRRAHLHDG